MPRATGDAQHAPGSLQHAACNTQHATRTGQHATYNMHRAACNNTQHAPGNTPLAQATAVRKPPEGRGSPWRHAAVQTPSMQPGEPGSVPWAARNHTRADVHAAAHLRSMCAQTGAAPPRACASSCFSIARQALNSFAVSSCSRCCTTAEGQRRTRLDARWWKRVSKLNKKGGGRKAVGRDGKGWRGAARGMGEVNAREPARGPSAPGGAIARRAVASTARPSPRLMR
jgi:hypothetical protein